MSMLFDDIMSSLNELKEHAEGKPTGVVVHRRNAPTIADVPEFTPKEIKEIEARISEKEGIIARYSQLREKYQLPSVEAACERSGETGQESTSFCTECGNPRNNGEKFCGKCGHKF